MRVLWFVNTFPPGYTGGAEVSTINTVRGLVQQGVECLICVLRNRESDRVDEWNLVDGLQVHRLLVKPVFGRSSINDVYDRRIYRLALREIRRFRPDIVHVSNVSGSSLAPFLACRKLRIPVVNTLHDLWLLCANNMLYRGNGEFCNPVNPRHGCGQCLRKYDFWGSIPMRRKLFSALTATVDTFISPSQALIDRHIECGYERSRFRLIRYGIKARGVKRPVDPTMNRILRTSNKWKTILFSGGGVEIKGAKVVQAAIPQLLARLENVRVVVAGGGDLIDKYKEFGPRVDVLGVVDYREMPCLFSIADLVLVPSVWHENLPIVIYESFQQGSPVVGTNFGGIPEIVDDGATGYLIEKGNAAQLANAVERHFSSTAAEQRAMRRNCYRAIESRFNYDDHIQQTISLYQDVLQTS